MFRRRPGRLPKVLCTFNLRSASTRLNHSWFLYVILHWAEIAQKKKFITADFKLESAKNGSKEDPKLKRKFQVHLEIAFWECVSCTPSAYYEHGTNHEVSYLIHYDNLLQNVTVIITKCDRYYYKMRQLLQNATFNTKCNSTYFILSFP